MARFRNPVLTDDHGIDRGDPFVLQYLDRYYLYHTSENRGPGILVYSSTDLIAWEEHGYAITPSDEQEHWAQTDLWAPEVMYERGTFYMYVTGTRRAADGSASEEHRRQGLARSSNPTGPFVFDDRPLVEDEWTIDGHPLRDEDGITWLVYNTRERIWDPATSSTYLARQTGNVIDQLVTPDRLAGRPSIVSFPTEEWEGNGDFFWNEGAWVLRRGGRYHLLYSGCDYRDRGYAVGLLTSSNPRGPWIKHPDNPILRSGERIVGPGHPSVALAPDGVTPYIIYHAYVDDPRQGRKVHIDRVQWAGDQPVIGEPSGTPTATAQRYPPQPVYDADVATWIVDFWSDAEWCEIGGVRVDLPGDTMCRIRAANDHSKLRVWVDDRRVHVGPTVDGNAISCSGDGTPSALSLTSCFDDVAEHILDPGEHVEWTWAGRRPVEITMALHGSCLVTFGDTQVQAEHTEGRYGLFRMMGVIGDSLKVRALASGVRVRDVFVVARESGYLHSYPEAVEPGEATPRDAAPDHHAIEQALDAVSWTWIESEPPPPAPDDAR
ncbi:MAG: glycoside hydrolase family 43 [Thermoleophilia bacterium]|nr:glycoside hydrolase family 43 [Thermoleophilia bacterium]